MISNVAIQQVHTLLVGLGLAPVHAGQADLVQGLRDERFVHRLNEVLQSHLAAELVPVFFRGSNVGHEVAFAWPLEVAVVFSGEGAYNLCLADEIVAGGEAVFETLSPEREEALVSLCLTQRMQHLRTLHEKLYGEDHAVVFPEFCRETAALCLEALGWSEEAYFRHAFDLAIFFDDELESRYWYQEVEPHLAPLLESIPDVQRIRLSWLGGLAREIGYNHWPKDQAGNREYDTYFRGSSQLEERHAVWWQQQEERPPFFVDDSRVFAVNQRRYRYLPESIREEWVREGTDTSQLSRLLEEPATRQVPVGVLLDAIQYQLDAVKVPTDGNVTLDGALYRVKTARDFLAMPEAEIARSSKFSWFPYFCEIFVRHSKDDGFYEIVRGYLLQPPQQHTAPQFKFISLSLATRYFPEELKRDLNQPDREAEVNRLGTALHYGRCLKDWRDDVPLPEGVARRLEQLVPFLWPICPQVAMEALGGQGMRHSVQELLFPAGVSLNDFLDHVLAVDFHLNPSDVVKTLVSLAKIAFTSSLKPDAKSSAEMVLLWNNLEIPKLHLLWERLLMLDAREGNGRIDYQKFICRLDDVEELLKFFFHLGVHTGHFKFFDDSVFTLGPGMVNVKRMGNLLQDYRNVPSSHPDPRIAYSGGQHIYNTSSIGLRVQQLLAVAKSRLVGRA